MAANVPQKHVSWLETGRSQPSREMIERLSDAMRISLRERNVLLQSAGYSSGYRETALDEHTMAPVMDALNHVLLHHEPLPALVVDRFWNVKKKNKGAELLLGLCDKLDTLLPNVGASKETNLALLTVHPEGLRQYISNWERPFLRRIRSEALATVDPQVQAQFEEYLALAGAMPESDPSTESLLPVLPLELNINGLELSLFSVISTFGTPQDITTDELRIEAFYPTNEATEQFFKSLQP
ncbi:MAG: hypothetical protein ACI9JM_000468 [Halioglobus sp.]